MGGGTNNTKLVFVWKQRKGIWADFGVKMIGVDVNAINVPKDRKRFQTNCQKKIIIPSAPAKSVLLAARGKGFPCSRTWFPVSDSYTYVGEQGFRNCVSWEDFDELLTRGVSILFP
jgi:carbamoyl-phosphate synthase large subunit